MNVLNLAGLGLVIIAAILMIALSIINRKQPMKGLRAIPAFNRLRQAIGLAVEDGSRLHVSLGSGGIITPQMTSGLVGLTVLERVAQLSSVSDSPPVATSGEGTLAILSQDTLRATYRAANAPTLYDPTRGQMTGVTPFSYAAGTLPVMSDENVSANILIGNFGSEAALLGDAAERHGTFTLAGSDTLPGQAVLYATTRDALIGEELFASGAYLNAGAVHASSLRVQDILRWLVLAALLVGAVLRLVGVL